MSTGECSSGGVRPVIGLRLGLSRQKGDPMILLLAMPVVVVVALAHRYLLLCAPSNVLIRRVRASRPRVSTVAKLLALTGILLVAMKVVAEAVATGAPGWLNLVVLIVAWDAIKIGWLAIAVLVRWFARVHRRPRGAGSGGGLSPSPYAVPAGRSADWASARH